MNKMIVALVAATFGLSTAAIAQTTPPAPQSPAKQTINIGGTELQPEVLGAGALGIVGLGLIMSDSDSNGTTTTTGTN